MRPYLMFLFAFNLLHLAVGLIHRCPPSETLDSHCSCSKSQKGVVEFTCKEFKHAFDLQTTLRKFQEYVIDKMTIRKSGVLELTPGAFSKLSIHHINFEEVQFNVLPLFSFLDGVHSFLENLQFINCNVSQWVWDRGTQFSFLEGVHFINTILPESMARRTFSTFPNNIRQLKLKRTGIKLLLDSALRKFGRLQKLELEDNKLTTYNRSTFPLPANRLIYFSLTNNPLKSLPADAFVQMSRLEFLSLAATHLTVLHQNTFKPVWKQLEEVYFNNIVLNCDCNSTWLLDEPHKSVYKAPMCKEVNGKKNKPLNHVKHLEICPDTA